MEVLIVVEGKTGVATRENKGGRWVGSYLKKENF